MVDPLISEFVKEGTHDVTILPSVEARLSQFSAATGVSWSSVSTSVNAMPELWGDPDDEVNWELPMHVHTVVVQKGFSEQHIDGFLANDNV